MRRISTAAVVLLAALVIAILAVSAAPGAGRPLYLNPHASISARVNDLVHRMTLEEKVGQMDQIVIGKLRDSTPPRTATATTRAATTTRCRRRASSGR
jgi:beta-glucosidase